MTSILNNLDNNRLDVLLSFIGWFTVNTVMVIILARWLYYGATKRKDFLFTYIIIGAIVFLICYVLSNVKIELSFALGIFAIFSILRYRTDLIPIKEMTYLFLIIGVSILNGLGNQIKFTELLLFANAVIIMIVIGLEKIWLIKHESAKTILYEKIDLIKAGKQNELIADLQERTGIEKINRIEIGRIDFSKDTCTIIVYYNNQGNTINLADSQENIS